MKTHLIALTAVTVPAAFAHAQATLISQSRSTSPGGSGPAAGFGLYTNSGVDFPGDGSSRSASQTSDLTAAGATFSLAAASSSGGANSLLTFVFDVPAGTTFNLSGAIEFGQGPPYPVSGGGSLHFFGPGVDFFGPSGGIYTTIPFTLSGVLSGGTYTLQVQATASGVFQQGGFRGGNGSVNGSLTLVPAPGAAATLGLCGLASLRRRR